jgi:hypothetical protein
MRRLVPYQFSVRTGNYSLLDVRSTAGSTTTSTESRPVDFQPHHNWMLLLFLVLVVGLPLFGATWIVDTNPELPLLWWFLLYGAFQVLAFFGICIFLALRRGVQSA